MMIDTNTPETEKPDEATTAETATAETTTDNAAKPDDAAEPETTPAKARRQITSAKPKRQITSAKPKRQITVSVSGLAIGALILALVAALVVFVVRDVSARSELDALRTDTAGRAHAEEVAGQYAVNAATLDYQDLTPWIANMKKGVSDDLKKQYDVIGQAMEQVLTPLRMQTTAELVVAKTTGVSGDIYRVQAVVNVNTKSVQTPNGGQTTAVYGITLDKSQDWLITSVGDPTSALGGKLSSAPQTGENSQTGPGQTTDAPAPAPAAPGTGG